jgi:hypothetical protein
MTPKPPKLAIALLKRIAGQNDALMGDLEEQFRNGRSRTWFWSQTMGIVINRCVHQHSCAACLVFAAFVIGTGSTVGWWGTRFAVPALLGLALTSWKMWKLHRTSLVILYITSIALVAPQWMAGVSTMSGGDRLFWTIARVLGGYGVVGVLLVPFLVMRLGRLGPLAEPPVQLTLRR